MSAATAPRYDKAMIMSEIAIGRSRASIAGLCGLLPNLLLMTEQEQLNDCHWSFLQKLTIDIHTVIRQHIGCTDALRKDG